MTRAELHLPRWVRSLLDTEGVVWRAERGGKATKIYVGGRMVQTLPASHMRCGHYRRNVEANLRRAVKEATRG